MKMSIANPFQRKPLKHWQDAYCQPCGSFSRARKDNGSLKRGRTQRKKRDNYAACPSVCRRQDTQGARQWGAPQALPICTGRSSNTALRIHDNDTRKREISMDSRHFWGAKFQQRGKGLKTWQNERNYESQLTI